MEFLKTILAKLLSSFKAKNPLVYLLIVSVLVGAKVFLDNGDFLGPNEEKYTEWVLFILAILGGSHTSEILAKEEKKK